MNCPHPKNSETAINTCWANAVWPEKMNTCCNLQALAGLLPASTHSWPVQGRKRREGGREGERKRERERMRVRGRKKILVMPSENLQIPSRWPHRDLGILSRLLRFKLHLVVGKKHKSEVRNSSLWKGKTRRQKNTNLWGAHSYHCLPPWETHWQVALWANTKECSNMEKPFCMSYEYFCCICGFTWKVKSSKKRAHAW